MRREKTGIENTRWGSDSRILWAPAVASALLCLLVLAMSGCNNDAGNNTNGNNANGVNGGTTATSPLKLTINSWIGWAPLFVAQEKNLFGSTAMEITRVEDAGARKATMLAGRVDGYVSSVDNFALDAATGVPGKIVLAFDESHGGDGIVARKSIPSVKALKGKTVAFQPGFPGHFLLLHVLQDAGLTIHDIQKQEMDSDKAGAAFAAGKIDAAVTWEPWLSRAEEKAGHKLITTKELPGLIVDTVVFREEVLQERPQDVRNFTNGWFKALDYIKAHPAEANLIMSKAYKLSTADLKAQMSGVKFYDRAANLKYIGDKPGQGPIYKIFAQAGNFWKQAGIIKSVSDGRQKIDGSFLTEVTP